MRKQKRRKKPAFLQKRKHFSTIFIRRWLVIFWLTAAAYVAGVLLFIDYSQNQARTTFQECNHSTIDCIRKTPEGENSFSAIRNEIKMRVCGCASGYGITYLLYDPVTLEPIVDCEETLFLIEKKNKTSGAYVPLSSVRNIYSCPTSSIAGWEEHRRKMADAQRPGMFLNEEMRLESFYLKEDRFYPAEMEIKVTGHKKTDALILMTEEESTPAGEADTAPYVPNIVFTSEFSMSVDGAGSPIRWNSDDYMTVIWTGYSVDAPYILVEGTDTAMPLGCMAKPFA